MLMITETTTRDELETAICCDKSLYAQFDEAKLLNGDYSMDELRQIVTDWIISGDECAAA